MRMKRTLVFTICILLVPVAAITTVRWLWIKNFNLPKDFVTKQQLAEINALGPLLQDLGAKMRKGNLPVRYINLKTIGATDKEADLQTFRRFVEIYELTFGNLPERSSDLDNLASTGTVKSSLKSQIKSIAKQCSILTFARDSYLLNCDGWQQQSLDETRKMIGVFDQKTEKFYMYTGHVFIYAPPTFAARASKGMEPSGEARGQTET